MSFRPSVSDLRRSQTQSGGMALIVVLFALSLVTIVILAYFDLAVLNRSTSFSSAGQARANLVALSALDFIKGDFIAEMQSGSAVQTDPSGSGVPIYLPSTNSTMSPYRMTANVTTTNFPPNLVKWSSGTYPLWPASTAYAQAGPIRAYSGISTANASLNGHSIGNSRWAKPDFGTNATFPTKVVPEWAYLTRQGPLTNAAPSLTLLANSATGNSSYVVGRYAYTVYDEGGLLDVAAAGYSPTLFSSDPTDVGRKGSQGFADLTQIGLTTSQVDQLVNWRNATTSASTNSYVGYLTTNTPSSGFLQTAPGDQTFLSRQDLIQYWTSQLNASTNLLQYVTTFTREKNAPSWGPEHNAYDAGSAYWKGASTNTIDPMNTSSRISYAYKDNQNSTNAVNNASQYVYNRFLPNVRVTTPFNRLSGKSAVAGEPLVRNRFDLNKLAWIIYNYTTSPAFGATATNIYNYFGLASNSDGSWTYNHGDSSRILRLDEVAAAGREPDLFELVQAVILQGGLGLCSGDPTQTSSSTLGGEFTRYTQGLNISTIGNAADCPIYRYDKDGKIVYAQEKYQVMQIVANLIDQYDADSYPTEIILNGEHFYGIENLPYLHAFADTALRAAPGSLVYPPTATSVVASYSQYQAYVHRWLTVSLWNPHQNAGSPATTSPGTFRVCVTAGDEYPILHNLGLGKVAGTDWSGRTFEGTASTVGAGNDNNGPNTDGPAWLGFYITNYPGRFSEPTPISYSASFTDPALGGSANMNHPDGRIATSLGWQRAGIYMGWSRSPDNTNKVSQCAPIWTLKTPPSTLYDAANMTYLANAGGSLPAPTLFGLTLDLQYQDAAGTWHTYEEVRGLIQTRDGRGDAYMEPSDPEWAKWTSITTAAVSSHGPLATNQEAWVTTFLDPRTPRINASTLRNGSADFLSLSPNFGSASSLTTAGPTGPHFYIVSGGSYTGASLVNNLSTNTAYYSDRDFITRVGDAAGWSGANPLTAGATYQRPLHLDRPFRSVAEIGYVFRDSPWKNLNLISANSADSGLADIFYIGSTPNATPSLPPPDMVAGKMNINSAVMNSVYANSKNSLPLQALLSQGLRYYSASNTSVLDTSISTNTISTTDALNLTTNIIAYAQTNALMNVGDLPALFPQTTATSTQNPGLKAPREALVRSLADSSDTRTWNLMIDVIAQAGKISPKATSLNDFTVEGEKHYWLHVAIDRFTGEIVDQQLEPVWE